MRWTTLLAGLPTVVLASRVLTDNRCRVIPGDDSWPAKDAWSEFNTTVRGQLIRTVPIAAVCHGDSYDKDSCDVLRDNWFFPETHLSSASSPMAYQASNNSCNPFLEPDAPCNTGGLVAYTVNATSVEDFKNTIKFCKANNIRLVIRNTGHDFLGKSNGAHGVALWTRHLKSVELLEDFNAQGPAIKVGAGVDGGEAQSFAHSQGLMVVTGNCPTVSIAGGFTQGGGHSPLSSFLGIGADQVLEYEVVTSNGDLVTASPTQNEDLFWALTGGGGGTYGVVYSMTIKAYPEVPVSVANLMVPRLENSTTAIQEFLSTFLLNLPTLVDAGVFLVWAFLPAAFLITPAYAPNLTTTQLDALFSPTLSALTTHSLPHTYTSAPFPDYHTAFTSQPAMWNVSDHHPSGRFLPRSLLTTNLPGLTSAILHVASITAAAGVSYNAAPHLPSHPIAASPHFRTSISNFVTGLPLNYSASPAEWAAADRQLVEDVLGPVRALAPEGGAYLSEASLEEPGWEREFYGGNYARLLEVKDRWDGDEVFYVPSGVGSHRWVERGDGRLCRVEEGEGGKGDVKKEGGEGHGEL